MRQKLNHLEHVLPEGLVVDSTWMNEHGYSRSLRNHYVHAGWLEQPANRVFRRPRGELDWRNVIASLQLLMGYELVVGGRTALELQGYAHYMEQALREVHLYGPQKPPTWLNDLTLDVKFRAHRSTSLFRDAQITRAVSRVEVVPGSTGQALTDNTHNSLSAHRESRRDWPLVVSGLERALLELLDELPEHESFHQVDMLFEGLSQLSPTRLQTLLEDCRSIKVKRLFFFFSDRHRHSWAKRVDRDRVYLGAGKRQLVEGGRYEPDYGITVPQDF